MTKTPIIWAGEEPLGYSREIVGGKGLYLLKLHQVAKNTGMFNVPNFAIVSTEAERDYVESGSGAQIVYRSGEVENAFNKLKKPVILRSSSPLEDGVSASFAGMFKSFNDQNDYEDAKKFISAIHDSVFQDRVKNYAEMMGIPLSHDMAVIFQEQVTDFWKRGVIQLEEDRAIIEETSKNGRKSSSEQGYGFLDNEGPFEPYLEPHNFISEGESYYNIQCVREAKKILGLDGIVQAEFLLSPAQLPCLVQIRQLPKVNPFSAQLELKIPEGVPYIESEVCNDVPGDLTLPAYVTVSEHGLKKILIGTGQQNCLGFGPRDEGADIFNKKSTLAQNKDFQAFRELIKTERKYDLDPTLSAYYSTWKNGDNFFDDYILVCDKLDDKIVDMSGATSNKRAIITCLEAEKTSHAMTIARETGIMCMGLEKDIMSNLDSGFFHNVETGDMIHMKSDGKRAVAYVEKKREQDPYLI